jgi:nucleotide sugar dehydrogenase
MGWAVPRVAVVGSGYVGTVVAACLASVGHEVIGIESDAAKVELLAQGRSPFYEPGLDVLLAAARESGRLRFTADLGEGLDHSDVVFLCVGTPPGPDGHADTSAVRAAVTAIGEQLRTPHVLVTKSTVPIGSGHWVESVLEDAYGGTRPIGELAAVVSCPEFLREGNAIEDFLHPDRVVLGSDDPAALDVVAEVYRPVLSQEFPGGRPDRRPALLRTGLLTAETVKYAANAFLATKVSFANEIANICEHVGADITEVAAAIGLDSRIGPHFLKAGLGWGGSCFGKDLSELITTAADYGHDARLLRATRDINYDQRAVVVSRLRRHLKTLQGKRVCLLGLAFKKGTDDLRDAPAIDIARLLTAAGALVTAHDPVVTAVPDLPDLRVCAEVLAAVDRADAIVVVTDWPAYAEMDLTAMAGAMRGRLVLDGRNLLHPDAVAAAGLVYEGVGRGSAAAGWVEEDDRPAAPVTTWEALIGAHRVPPPGAGRPEVSVGGWR